MKTTDITSKNYIEYSLINFKGLASFKRLFENIKNTVEIEEKTVLNQKKEKTEKIKYFNMMNFFFTSPDKNLKI